MNYHSSLGGSPFEVLYGHSPMHFGIHVSELDQVQHIGSWLQERKLMNELIRQHLLSAQVRMKSQADRHHSKVQFSVGDNVFLKLQPYVQLSLAVRAIPISY
jgi:hypothetical protein